MLFGSVEGIDAFNMLKKWRFGRGSHPHITPELPQIMHLEFIFFTGPRLKIFFQPSSHHLFKLGLNDICW